MAWQNFPMITCPHCDKESQLDDYYDYTTGDSHECSYCEREYYIAAVDVTISADIVTEP